MCSAYVADNARTGAGEPSAPHLLSESACATLRSRLVRVEIMPGERLSEPELRSSLGVGTSPVREAIRRLEFEKLIVIYPRSGTFATDIALKDSRSVMELRLQLEGLAAELACGRGSKAEKEQLVAIAERQFETDDLQQCIDLDAAFHHGIYRMTRNDYLTTTAEIHFNLALRQWYFCSKVVETPDWTGVDHRPLAAAIAGGDAESAGRHIREHVLHDSQQIVDILTNYGL
ncbi:GntR family transcriptional regulator [Streptosporangium roseum]|uniref:Transcriptional regulator, GntR family n=1 Tax=Streptosporangium roseum (strain ATCC 12428 / DSM 43021 / JCM 3005 / KCTC 9067 / NCIMB 10171 / NRRL 2505 / NI 9100) TaxID=479432 RepID=D2ARH5_STRRD|nr:GntR family transcriptional regulator [Streptosporangium roseum]ACZ90315.1 transcriptional regulator, GntR family [Streptosporangium roseum DSM 43021]